MKTRVVLNGHVSFFGMQIPVHWTVDIPDVPTGEGVPVTIPAIHFTGTASATHIPSAQKPLPLGGGGE